MSHLRWATLGTGVIANELAQALAKDGRKLYAVANRTYEKGLTFAAKYGIDKVYSEIDQVFEDPEVDVIYISTPHNTHIDYLRKALRSGKHVLCEKAITLNAEELEEAVALAEEKGLVLAEAMTIFHMPLYKKLTSYLAEGHLGAVQMLQVNFGSYKEYDMTNRFFSRDLAGGALLDIGVYALSFTSLFMDIEDASLQSQVQLAPTGVDERAGILLANQQGQIATITLSLHAKQAKRATVICDKGYVEVFDYPRGQEARIVFAEDGREEIIQAGDTSLALSYEVKDMEAAIAGLYDMNLASSRKVMDVMTRLRQDWGLRYPEEEESC